MGEVQDTGEEEARHFRPGKSWSCVANRRQVWLEGEIPKEEQGEKGLPGQGEPTCGRKAWIAG